MYFQHAWPLDDCFFNNANAQYGWYHTTVTGSGSTSADILYSGGGASIAYDEVSYSQNQLATMTYSINGGSWDPGSYSYKVAIMSGNTGQFIHNESISLQSGTKTYTWTTSDTQGVYYAALIATPTTGGQDIWMGIDWADVNAYVTFTGYVNGAETNAVLSGADVNFTQGSTVSHSVTIADGNYTATGFLTGATMMINVTKSGYSQYNVSLIPLAAGSKTVNITLNSTTPTYTGLGIGGVARTGVRTGDTVTSGYGQPIEGATVFVQNTSTWEYYTRPTNMAGWYLCDEGASCFLTTKRPYDIWGSKIGYSNSQNYTVVTV
jgi:hypothetical protein